jgi:hypothetical protein
MLNTTGMLQLKITQVKLQANEGGVEMMLVNYCDCLKIRYPERHDKINIFVLKSTSRKGEKQLGYFNSSLIIFLVSPYYQPIYHQSFVCSCTTEFPFSLLHSL